MKHIRRFTSKNSIILFLLPSLICFSEFYLIPFFAGLRYAFYDKPVNGNFIGFGNFTSLFGNATFLLALKNTLIFMGIAVPLNIIFPLMLSLAIRRVLAGGLWFRNVFLSPLVVPTAAVAFFWRLLLNENGYANYLLNGVNIAGLDFLQGRYALISVAMIYLWKNIGYNMIIFAAALTGIPNNYYEAARLETSNPIKVLFFVTLPSLAPTLFFIFVISIINCFKVFKEIYILAGARPSDSLFMLQHFMNNMFKSLNYPRLTASAFILTVGIVIIIFVLFAAEKRNYELSSPD